jgi:hypothetical protein
MATILTIFIGMGALALLASGLPRRKEAWDLDDSVQLLPGLRRRREQLLRAIKDLDREWQAGARPEETFQSARDQLKSQAIAVSKEMHRLRKARLRALAKAGAHASKAQASRIDEAIRLRRAALRGADLRGPSSTGGESS